MGKEGDKGDKGGWIQLNIISPGILRIGCHHKPIGEWLNEYERIGRAEVEIAEYKRYLDLFNEIK